MFKKPRLTLPAANIKRSLISLAIISASITAPLSFAETTIIKNVNGYTVNSNGLSKFSAIKFTDGNIDKVYASINNIELSKDVSVIDGNGKTMLPGLIDAHGHILNYGLSLMRADLVDSKSEEAAVQRVVEYAKQNKDLVWIQGRGWNQVQWPSNTFPTAKTLDKYFPNTPVFLSRVDGHAGWANSKAMEIAGINKQTKSPVGGEIIKDNQGNPTGVFIDNAMDLIYKSIAPLTPSEQKATLIKAMDALASVGLTSVHDAGIDTANLNAFKALANENKMSIRVNAMLYLPSENWQDTLATGQYVTKDNMLSFNSVKIQADGALGSRGAAMHEDYSDKKNHKGLLLHSYINLSQYIKSSMENGFQVNTHAIGDHANTLTLNLYKKYINETKSKNLRHRVEHAQVLRLNDIPKFKELGVIASIQATHATSDKNMAEDRIGAKRLEGAYAWRSLLNAGARIANGSDFPVEPTNPFYGLHASITRQDRQNQPLGGWIEKESLTPIEALKSFTLDAAYAGHQEKLIGSLEAGKKADFIIIEQDIMEIDPKDIWKTKVLSTWVNVSNTHGPIQRYSLATPHRL